MVMPDPKILKYLRAACKLIWPFSRDFRMLMLNGGLNSDIVVVAPHSRIIKTTLVACVMNDQGQLLPHTVRAYKSQVEEAAEANELFAEGVWDNIKRRGAKVVNVELLYVGHI